MVISLQHLYLLSCNSKRKGFLRNKFKFVEYSYHEIDGIVDKQTFGDLSTKSEYGDVFFSRDRAVGNSVASEEWKIDTQPNSKKSTFIGFKSIRHADEGMHLRLVLLTR